MSNHAEFTASATKFFTTVDQVKARLLELQRMKTQVEFGARLAPGAVAAFRADVKKTVEIISKSLYIDVKMRFSQVEAARQIRAAFVKPFQVRVVPYATTADIKGVKDRIGKAIAGVYAEVGLRFQAGAAQKFRSTLRKMLEILSRGAYIDAQLRLTGAAKSLDALKNRKIFVEVEVATGSAAKIRALLDLLKSLRAGAKIPVKLEIDPALAPLLKDMARDLKAAGDQASRLQARLGSAVGAAKKLKSAGDSAASTFEKLRDVIMAIDGSIYMMQAFSTAFQGLKAALWDFPIALQNIQVGFETLFDGNTKKARGLLDALKQFAIPTPFKTADLASYAQQALAMGLVDKNSKTLNADMISLLNTAGNTAFALGKGTEGVQTIIQSFGVMHATTVAQRMELKRLYTEGVPVFKYLSDAMGVSTAKAIEMVHKGLVPADFAIRAIRKGMDKDFGTGMARATGTLTGAFAKISDTLKVLFSDANAKGFDQLTSAVVEFSKELSTPTMEAWVTTTARGVSAGIMDMARAAEWAGGVFVDKFPYIVGILGVLGGNALITGVITMGTALADTGLAAAGAWMAANIPLLAAIVAVTAFVAEYRNIEKLREYTLDFGVGVMTVFKGIAYSVAWTISKISAALQMIPNSVLELGGAAGLGLLGLKNLVGGGQEDLAADTAKQFDDYTAALINGVGKVNNFMTSNFGIGDIWAKIKKEAGFPGLSLGAGPMGNPGGDDDAGDPSKAQKDAVREFQGYSEQYAKALDDQAEAFQDSAKKQIAAITELRDAFRGFFGDAQDELLKMGVINDPLGPVIGQFEKFLSLGSKAKQIGADAKNKADTLHIESYMFRASAAAKAAAADDDSTAAAPPRAGSPVAGPSSTGMAIAQFGLKEQLTGAARDYKGYCEKLLRTTVEHVTPMFDKVFVGTRSAAETMRKFQANGIGFAPGKDYRRMPGDMLYNGSSAGGLGHAMLVGPNGQIMDQYGPHQKPTVPIQWVVRPGGGTLPAPGGQSAVSRGKFYDSPPTPVEDLGANFDAFLGKDSALPASWGAGVKDVTGSEFRFKAQTFLASRQVQDAMTGFFNKGGSQADLDKVVGAFRAGANNIDYIVNNEKSLQDYAATMDASIKSTDALILSERNKQLVLQAGLQYLDGSTEGMRRYERAQFQAQKTIEYWNSPEVVKAYSMMKDLDALGDKGDKAAKARAGAMSDQLVSAGQTVVGAQMLSFDTEAVSKATVDGDGDTAKRSADERAFQADIQKTTALMAFERGILKDLTLNDQERAAAIEKYKYIQEQVAQMEAQHPPKHGSTYTPNEIGVFNDVANANADQMGAAGAFSAPDLSAWRTSHDELTKSTALFGDTSELAAAKFETLQGALKGWDDATKESYLNDVAGIEGLKAYGQEVDALNAQMASLHEEQAKRTLADSGVRGSLPLQEIEWAKQDQELAAQRLTMTDAQKAAYDAQLPSVLALRDAVRGLLKDQDARKITDFLQSTQDDTNSAGNLNPRGQQWDRLRKSAQSAGLDDSTIDSPDMKKYLIKMDDLRQYREQVGKVLEGLRGDFEGLFDGIAEHQKKPLKAFFDSIKKQLDESAASILSDQAMKQLTGAFGGLFSTIFRDPTAPSQSRNTLAGGGRPAAGSSLAALAAAGIGVAPAPGVVVPQSGGSGGLFADGLGGVLSAGFGALFGSVFSHGGSSAPAPSSAVPTAQAPWEPGALTAIPDPGMGGGSGATFGAIGIPTVPYDGFPAVLHRGEAVLTRGDAETWRGLNSGLTPPQGSGSGGGHVTHNYNVSGDIHLPNVREPNDFGPELHQQVSRRTARHNSSDNATIGGYNR